MTPAQQGALEGLLALPMQPDPMPIDQVSRALNIAEGRTVP